MDFTLYFDIQDLAYAALGSLKTAQAWTGGNCTGDRPAEPDAPNPPFLCIGYPEVSGILDTTHAELKRYRVTSGATLSGRFWAASGYLRSG